MQKSINVLLDKILFSFDSNALYSFFQRQFGLIAIEDKVDMFSFNNYTGLPHILSEKLFNAFSPSQSNYLIEEDFINGMSSLYSDSLYTRAWLVFTFLDYDNCASIRIDDVKFFLFHFHLMTNKTDIKDLNQQVDLMFNNQLELDFPSFLSIAKDISSDLIVLMMVYFYQYIPVKESCIEYYELINIKSDWENIQEKRWGKNENEKDKKQYTFSLFQKDFIDKNEQKINDDNDKRLDKRKTKKSKGIELIEPSSFLYEYLSLNFGWEFQACEKKDNVRISQLETEEDLDELLSFEEELTELKTKVMDISTIKLSIKEHFYESTIINRNRTRIHSCHIPQMINELENNDIQRSFNNQKKMTLDIHSIQYNQIINTPLNIHDISSNKEKKDLSSLILFEMSSNNNHFFLSKCTFINHCNNTKYEATISIIGNMLFIQRTKDLIEKYNYFSTISVMLLMRKVFISPNSFLDNNTTNTITLISTIKGQLDSYSFLFDNKDQSKDFIDMIYHKTNHRKFEDEYIEENILGSGASGIVRLVKHRQTNKTYAVKILSLDYYNRKDTEFVYNELDISKLLSKINNDNIVKFYDYFETYNNVYIITEYLNGMTLDRFIKLKHHQFKSVISTLTGHLIDSLHTINIYGIIHRDIKPQNIMIVVNDNDYQLKLIDFGFSKVICREERLHGSVGTILFASPELVLNKIYSINIDLWSLGVILYRILYDVFPFNHQGDHAKEVMTNIVEEQIVLPPHRLVIKEEGVIRDIIMMCLEKDSAKRASINDVYKLWKRNYMM